jgi:hypothetical protein
MLPINAVIHLIHPDLSDVSLHMAAAPAAGLARSAKAGIIARIMLVNV